VRENRRVESESEREGVKKRVRGSEGESERKKERMSE
jgi:hypothetical protein